MQLPETYIVILAGGQGQRLWPLSRVKKPKQLLTYKDNLSLLKSTVDRVTAITPHQKTWIVAHDAYVDEIKQSLGNTIDYILPEPAAQNTAPAVLLACQRIQKENANALVAFLPADHFIQDQTIFAEDLSRALISAHTLQALILLGIPPTYAATGFGYIETEKTNIQGLQRIKKFHEKPSQKKAEEYLSNQQMMWNIGIFCAPINTFITEFQSHAPQLYEQMNAYIQKYNKYSEITPISFDYAVMEKTQKAYLITAQFDWSDVGDLETFLQLMPPQKPQPIEIQAAHNSITTVPGKLVVVHGVDNLCIVDTPDALLIIKKDHIQQVKEIIDILKKQNISEYL